MTAEHSTALRAYLEKIERVEPHAPKLSEACTGGIHGLTRSRPDVCACPCHEAQPAEVTR